eukprot:GEMP01024877.1.p1 GENE.GEMP01024877.1~~GEMP01024877.1.p1  ORF type:complete len:248 (+),score=78.10 GEMP01024877.1:58-801(+)
MFFVRTVRQHVARQTFSRAIGATPQCAGSAASKFVARAFTTSSPSPPTSNDKTVRTMLFDGEEEVLTAAEAEEKEMLIKELKRRLSGPLADENGNVPTGKDRPTAIEVDGPSHFYANSQRYTAYTKLKHRLLTKMGYKVLHVPYFDWRKLRGAKEREEYMRTKLEEEPTEWLDPEDEKYYNGQMTAKADLEIPGVDVAPPPPPPKSREASAAPAHGAMPPPPPPRDETPSPPLPGGIMPPPPPPPRR